jgi:quercetin dioxygenase-like cupin family protein
LSLDEKRGTPSSLDASSAPATNAVLEWNRIANEQLALAGIVKEGTLSWYDQNCVLHTYTQDNRSSRAPSRTTRSTVERSIPKVSVSTSPRLEFDASRIPSLPAPSRSDFRNRSFAALNPYQTIPGDPMRNKIAVPILAALGISAAALATPPFNVLFNRILSKGTASVDLSEHVQVAGDAGADDEGWQLDLETQGASDFYIQDLAIAPGGYTGWHTHPGIFIGTVITGSVDFYNARCERTTFTAGAVWTENTEVHAVANHGSIDAHMQFVYLVKKGAPRRIDQPAPACAPTTGVP